MTVMPMDVTHVNLLTMPFLRPALPPTRKPKKQDTKPAKSTTRLAPEVKHVVVKGRANCAPSPEPPKRQSHRRIVEVRNGRKCNPVLTGCLSWRGSYFDTKTRKLAWFKRGAFADSIARDVITMWVNHEGLAGFATTHDGSLKLRETARGLEIEAIPWDVPAGHRAVKLLEDGKATGLSIGFRHTGKTNGPIEVTRLLEVSLLGPKNRPAMGTATSVELRWRPVREN